MSVNDKLLEIERACEEIAANEDKLRPQDLPQINVLHLKATEYLKHFRKFVPDWSGEQEVVVEDQKAVVGQ